MKSPAEWTPPPDPNPKAILAQAQKDIAAGRHPRALAKLLWFHRQVLEIDPAFTGVRLSYALDSWGELAAIYPPARLEMQKTRDDAEREVRSGGKLRTAFSDFRALNEVLDYTEKTLELFVWLHEEAPAQAKQAFDLARAALIQFGQIDLCGVYLDDDCVFQARVRGFQQNMRMAEDPRFGEEMREFGENYFSNQTATLVALLVLNGRGEEGASIAAEALELLDDPGFRELLDEAAQGVVPGPWP